MTEKRTLWALRLFALTLAVLAWFFTNLERGQSERSVEAAVQYDNPNPERFIVLEPVDTVTVRLRGSSNRISALNPLTISVVVELPEQTGLAEVPLTAQNILGATDLEVLSIEPNVLVLELDEVAIETKRVIARLDGEPAAGAIAGTAAVTPERVLVRGPASRVRELETLTTRPVSLDGHAIGFEELVLVVSPDPLVNVVEPPAVTVRVPLEIPNAPQPDEPSNIP